MVNDPRFLRAVHLEKTDCTPVWFMRQAGRYLEEYRRIRERHGLLDMFKNPEIAAEVTLQPLKAFPLDAAIIFADILLPLEAMGIELEFVEGEGPVIHNPVRTGGDVDALRVPDPEEHFGFLLTSIRWVRAELDGKVPLIGFGGGPFTLGSYMIEGGASRNYVLTKRLMYEQPASWNLLMDKLAVMLASYLLAHAREGNPDTCSIWAMESSPQHPSITSGPWWSSSTITPVGSGQQAKTDGLGSEIRNKAQ